MVYLVVPSLYFFGKKHLGPSSVSIINDNIRLLFQCSRKAISLAACKTRLGIPTRDTKFGTHHNGTPFLGPRVLGISSSPNQGRGITLSNTIVKYLDKITRLLEDLVAF